MSGGKHCVLKYWTGMKGIENANPAMVQFEKGEDNGLYEEMAQSQHDWKIDDRDILQKINLYQFAKDTDQMRVAHIFL